MDGFLKFFFPFVTEILMGFSDIFKGIFGGIARIFNIKTYIDIFNAFSPDFSVLDWILSILGILIVIGIFVLLFYMLYLGIRKYLRFRKSIVGQEDILEEVSSLHRQVVKLTEEKDKIMAMKVSQLGIQTDLSSMELDEKGELIPAEESQDETSPAAAAAAGEVAPAGESRFFKLKEVDEKYLHYTPPAYDNAITLEALCERFRNYACSRMGLYYDIRVVRLFFAGMASTKLLILQGISGTGKTSLPYAMGKFLHNDATIAAVQPSWRDRTELFGYFNEFTKRFNETEVLRKMYEASYTDDVNLIILDEMNIARIEYYFAEMLSILEMPNLEEWELDLVPSTGPTDPKKLTGGKLKIPGNMWYVGTANNDDSTFAISDKVYDRALPINLDAKGIAFDAPDTPELTLSYAHLSGMFQEAMAAYPVSQENLDKVAKLDVYVIEKIRMAFGNRIMKQMRDFVPVYVACGGTELDGIDYILANKIFRKFESLNLSFIREELKGLIAFMDKSFGKANMQESKAYLERLQRLF